MDLSVVIPARNETKRLQPTLEKVTAYLEKQGGEWELLVVDNGSTDGTDRLVEEFAQRQPRVKLLKEPRPGKGAALRTGMLAAAGELVLFSDADLSCPIEEEAKLRAAREKGYDIAIASRRLRGSEVDKTLRRKLMSALFNWVVQALALPGIKDSQCGFKLFRREAARRLFGAGKVDGFAFDVEVLFLARKWGYKIVEVPVRWREAEGTRVEALRDSVRMVRDIVRFRRDWVRGKYREKMGAARMRVLVTGAKGMLGSDLCARLRAEHELTAWDLEELDITDSGAVMRAVELEGPAMVIHCAAFTDVDGCEREPEKAYRVNGLGTWNVAAACQEIEAALVYISTDFVFDGEKGAPYDEFDAPNPIGVYGRSKYAGEIAVRQLVRRHFIVRTAWLYGRKGNNFVRTILNKAAKEKQLRVVADQVGCPTYSVDLAAVIADLIESPLYGTYHVTNKGECSWAQFAEEIVRQAGLAAEIIPIAASEWNSPTRRPKDSRLRHLALEMQGKDNIRPWQEALAEFISKT